MRFVLVFLLIIISLKISASHGSGAEITYTYLAENRYGITLNFYRDCAGIPAPTSPFIKIEAPSCGVLSGVYLKLSYFKEVSSYCVDVLTTCKGGEYVGIEKYVYYNEFYFTNKCKDWKLSYDICCRNGAITNIYNSGTERMYVYSTLDNTGAQNSSPVFNADPVPFVCIGNTYCIDNSNVDNDADSIVYSLVTPNTSNATAVVFKPTFNYLNPITSNPASTFNTSNGLFCFTPVTQQIDIMAVQVKSYTNGILINMIQRDFQITVVACSCLPLPVQLSYFAGYPYSNTNIIKWITECEINNDYFVLYRNDMPIDMIYGNGTISIPIHYEYTDYNPEYLSYYHLLQVDFDGKFFRSNSILVKNRLRRKVVINSKYNILGQRIY